MNICGEVDRSSPRDRTPHCVGVNRRVRRFELRDALHGEPTRDDDLRLRCTSGIQCGAHFSDEFWCDTAQLTSAIQSHAAESVTKRRCNALSPTCTMAKLIAESNMVTTRSNAAASNTHGMVMA